MLGTGHVYGGKPTTRAEPFFASTVSSILLRTGLVSHRRSGTHACLSLNEAFNTEVDALNRFVIDSTIIT